MKTRLSRWLHDWTIGWLIALAAFSATAATAADTVSTSDSRKDQTMTLTLTSSSFQNNGEIPSRHTCEGKDISPPLSWAGLPAGTQSLVLIVDDPDAPDPSAPERTWVHWLLYNVPPDANGLPEGVSAKELPAGTLVGKNDWRRTGYGGPCPPIGKHRYFFKLYALDTMLTDLKHPAKAALEKAMQGHVLGQTELIGLYQKQK